MRTEARLFTGVAVFFAVTAALEYGSANRRIAAKSGSVPRVGEANRTTASSILTGSIAACFIPAAVRKLMRLMSVRKYVPFAPAALPATGMTICGAAALGTMSSFVCCANVGRARERMRKTSVLRMSPDV